MPEGNIEIIIDAAARRITIEDNATGIPVLDFKSTLTNIADSDKTLETDRGLETYSERITRRDCIF